MATPPPQPPPLPYRSSRPARPQQSQLPRSLQSKRIDPSSPAYKQAARKYVSFMVAVPILLVTSYVLFDRLAMGSPTKTLHPEPQQVNSRLEERIETSIFATQFYSDASARMFHIPSLANQ
ncbi:hypothetical protein UCREL1_9920 [Eutypa lata UCREL1]|uniref:Transmembrane protein n=1 Tax=Eutypa lata (strain UCR-EL1) TaxID=1287681 RepID=M7SG61_EUTLA|nr:hypothetical protein UCREL1_9920 [Eutypa lata UCREL1]